MGGSRQTLGAGRGSSGDPTSGGAWGGRASLRVGACAPAALPLLDQGLRFTHKWTVRLRATSRWLRDIVFHRMPCIANAKYSTRRYSQLASSPAAFPSPLSVHASCPTNRPPRVAASAASSRPVRRTAMDKISHAASCLVPSTVLESSSPGADRTGHGRRFACLCMPLHPVGGVLRVSCALRISCVREGPAGDSQPPTSTRQAGFARGPPRWRLDRDPNSARTRAHCAPLLPPPHNPDLVLPACAKCK